MLQSKPSYKESPSLQDHQGFLDMIQLQLKNYKEYNNQPMWEKGNRKFKEFEKAKRRIGSVFAGSGYSWAKKPKYATDPNTGKEVNGPQPRNMILDWSLIELDEKKTDRNVVNRTPPDLAPGIPNSTLVPDMICDRWSVFDARKCAVPVAKVGRTGGWTSGTISGTLVRIDDEVKEGRYKNIADNYPFTKDGPVFCFQAVRSGGKTPFVLGGDSGSILMHNPSGTWLGLCFAASPLENGLFMPIDQVFQDIKKVTGLAVTSPEFISKSSGSFLSPY
jgi:hypothetical protein